MVFYGDSSIAGGHIAMNIGDRQGNRIGTLVGTIEGGFVEGFGGYSAQVGRAIVDHGRGDGGIARTIQLNGDILANYRWRSVVNNRNDGVAEIGVATRISSRHFDGIGPHVGAIESGLVGSIDNVAIVGRTKIQVTRGNGHRSRNRIQGAGNILTNGIRRKIVDNGGSRTANSTVSIVIGHLQVDGVDTCFTTTITLHRAVRNVVFGYFIFRNTTRISRAVIHIQSFHYYIAQYIEVKGYRLTNNCRNDVVHHRYGGITGRGISEAIGYCQHHCIGTNRIAVKGTRGYRKCNAIRVMRSQSNGVDIGIGKSVISGGIEVDS